MQVTRKVPWVKRGGFASRKPLLIPLCPDSQHLLLDPMKCHHQEQKGGGADIGIRMQPPALDYQPFGVQGAVLVENTKQHCSWMFPLPSLTNHPLDWVSSTLFPSSGANDREERMYQGHRSKYPQSCSISSLWLAWPAKPSYWNLQRELGGLLVPSCTLPLRKQKPTEGIWLANSPPVKSVTELGLGPGLPLMASTLPMRTPLS